MGLIDFVRRWFGGPPDVLTRAESSEEPAAPEAHASTRPRLAPLRYQSSLTRTAASVERVTSLPYRFARLAVDGQGYLDLSSDADFRWLDHFQLPHLVTPQDLADFVEMPLGKLAWLTHRYDDGARPPGVREAHYHYRWLPKRTGGHRLIEAPKRSLKFVQQTILRRILDLVPPHASAHGFTSGRSILTNAQPHVGQRVLLSIDLKSFYPSVRYSRVVAIFRSIGYSREVALWLARLTTSAIPASLSFPTGDPTALWVYYPRHLPQGAPTSPQLANLSAFSLDVRLAGLARKYDVRYTRYADDLTFSGSHRFAAALSEFIPLVTHIAKSERFLVNRRKRHVLRSNQRQSVTGVVVNAKTNVARDEFDRLKAILHNCVKDGPSTQNHDAHPDFAAHLAGRIGHMRFLNPRRAMKLKQLYDGIEWTR